jgi:digeranylgeranylglycerophospholipid reductase
LYHVIVIGAGPVGSYVAARLAQLGYEVAVLEKRGLVGGKLCCTGIIGMECVRTFAIDRRVIVREASGARLFSPSGKSLRVHRNEPQAAILDRNAFDAMMGTRAQQAGAHYILDGLATDIKVEHDRIMVGVSGNTGKSEYEARAVVIASGFGSGLTDKVGLGTASDFVAGAQVEVKAEVEEVEVYFGRGVAPGFFGWLVPTLPGRARVGLLFRRSARHCLKTLLDSLKAQGKLVSWEASPTYGAIPLKPLRKTYGERFLVVGDAAGQVKPTTGGGIYYGLIGGHIAADTLHQALQCNDLSARMLARYERGWKAKLGRELKVGYWARKAFESLSDRQIDQLFDIMNNECIAEVLLKSNEVSFDWHSQAIVRLIARAGIGSVLGMLRLPRLGSKDI